MKATGLFKWMHIVFLALFGASFTGILLSVIFNKSVYGYNALLLIAFILLYLCLFVGAVKFIEKNKDFISRHYRPIIFGAAVFMFCVQLCMIEPLRFNPIFDLEAIYKGAIEWAETGVFYHYYSDTCHANYFYIFPNNLGGLAFLTAIFKIAKLFGITDYFVYASVVNALLCITTMILTVNIGKKLFGVTGGMYALLFFLLSPPFYFIAPVFYTDALSLVFPVAAFNAVLKGEESEKLIKKTGWFALAGVMCLIGTQIKATVFILAIATVGYFLLKKKWKDILTFVLLTATIVGSGFAGFNAYIYSNQLDKEVADYLGMPIYYWLDLAFHGRGEYNNNIFQMGYTLEEPEIREERLKNDIKDSIEDMGPVGLAKLFQNKLTLAFGDGTYALSEYLDDRPYKKSFLHDYIIYNMKYYGFYRTLATGIFAAIMIMMLLSVSFRKRDLKILVPQLCVFGIMLFLMFWEIKSRYIMTFIPFIFICAASGMCSLPERIADVKNKITKKDEQQKETKAVIGRR